MNKHQKDAAIEAFGWYGALGLLFAYAFSSFGVFSPEGLWYQLLNISAAIGIATVSYHKKAYPPAVLNSIWAIVGLIALFKFAL